MISRNFSGNNDAGGSGDSMTQTASACAPATSPSMPGQRPGGRAPGHPGLRCPHCQSRAKIRTSRAVTPLFTEYRLQCTDIECDHAFTASLTIERTTRPSGRPNPRITLPGLAPRG